jgi:hypothetical protein
MAKATKGKKAVVQADFYVGFSGAIPQTNVDEPKLGEQVEYTVLGTVIDVGERLRDDNETRARTLVRVEAAWPKGTARPDNANQALMFDHEGNPTDEATEASADEGDEIMAERAEAAADDAGDEAEVDEYDQDAEGSN